MCFCQRFHEDILATIMLSWLCKDIVIFELKLFTNSWCLQPFATRPTHPQLLLTLKRADVSVLLTASGNFSTAFISYHLIRPEGLLFHLKHFVSCFFFSKWRQNPFYPYQHDLKHFCDSLKQPLDSRTTNLKAWCGGSWVNRSSEIEDIPRAKQAPSRQQMDHSQWKQKVLPCLLFPVDFLFFTVPLIFSNFCLHQYFWSGMFLPSPCCSICLGLSPEDHREPLMLPDVFHYTTVLQNNWLWWQPCETDSSSGFVILPPEQLLVLG